MINLKIEYFPFDSSIILMRRDKTNTLKFRINIEKHINDDFRNHEKLLSEYEKMLPMCNLIISFFRSNPSSIEDSLNEIINNPEIIKEFKSLLKSAYNPSTIMSFKMFYKRISDIYTSFRKENIYEFNQDSVEKPLVSERTHRVSLIRCNYCDEISLEPIFSLSECGCHFHKLCLENTIIETIECKELNSDYQLKRPCVASQNHLHSNDLMVLVEIEKDRFTLSKPIINMIMYYYLNFEEDATFYCNCNGEHKKVDRQSKRPYPLCNTRCSFCGDRWEENCPKFAKILNWSY
jgi:hypothetical protein